ncbi:hypothetical protein Tco_0959641 [Tanacetum coccineum]
MRTRSQSHNLHHQQQQAPPVVEPFNLEKLIENSAPPLALMDDTRTMAQLLQAPTEGVRGCNWRKILESPWGSPIPIGDEDGDVNRFPDGDGDGYGDEAEKRGWDEDMICISALNGCGLDEFCNAVHEKLKVLT